VLEVKAGVGHSGFATPGFRQGAVVRVLYRTTSPDLKTPLQTTGYKYFDPAGKEIVFDLYPRVSGHSRQSEETGWISKLFDPKVGGKASALDLHFLLRSAVRRGVS
jgi:hypothetical protein